MKTSLPDYLDLSTDAAASLQAFLNTKAYSQLAVLCDEHTEEYCLPRIQAALPQDYLRIRIRAGEVHKTLSSCTHIWQALTEAGFDRKALLINLGGGVIGDMGGFCASTYKRGIDFIQLPTTLLAAVDASLGGKLGIDFQGLKNHIGLFREPNKVIIDAEFLRTLPLRELRSGYAEVVKHALIADESLWQQLVQGPWQQHSWPEIIRRSVAIKQGIVQQDPFEKGIRKALNFGHTLGHALESHLLNEPKRQLLHGEAVAMGMQCAAWLSYQHSGLEEEKFQQIDRYLGQVWEPVRLSDADVEAVLSLSRQDKKNVGREFRFSLLNKLGSCFTDVVISEAQVREALNWYQKKGGH